MCAYRFHSWFLFSVHMSLESNQSSLFTCKTRSEEVRTGEPLGGKVSLPVGGNLGLRDQGLWHCEVTQAPERVWRQKGWWRNTFTSLSGHCNEMTTPGVSLQSCYDGSWSLWRSKVLCSLKACGEQFGFWAVEKTPRSRRADCISSGGFSGFFMAVSGMASWFSCQKLPMFSKDTLIVSEDALHTTAGFRSVPGALNAGFALPFSDLMGFFRSADWNGSITFGYKILKATWAGCVIIGAWVPASLRGPLPLYALEFENKCGVFFLSCCNGDDVSRTLQWHLLLPLFANAKERSATVHFCVMLFMPKMLLQ